MQASSARCHNDIKFCDSVDKSKVSSTATEDKGSVATRTCSSALPSIIEDEKTQLQCKQPNKQEASAPSMTENLLIITLENEAKLKQQDNISNNHDSRNAKVNPKSDIVSNKSHKRIKENNELIAKNSTQVLSVKTVTHNKEADVTLSNDNTIKLFSGNMRNASNSNRHMQDMTDNVCHYLPMFSLSQPSVNVDFVCSEILLENKSNHAMCADEEENSMPDLHPWVTSTTRYCEPRRNDRERTRRDDHERNFQSSATDDSFISVGDT